MSVKCRWGGGWMGRGPGVGRPKVPRPPRFMHRKKKAFISNEIKRTSEFVDGYQFIPINLPFFDNREYLFRMYPGGYKENDETSFIHWYLLDEDKTILKKENRSATYLNHGAGLWTAEQRLNNKTFFSYRIYMDPGGSLPSFLIDIINKNSVVNIFEDAVAEAQKRYQSVSQF